GGDLVFTVTRTATSEAERVDYQVSGTATPGVDFTAPSGSVNFAVGQKAAQIHVAVHPDAVVEPNETVTLTFTAATSGAIFNPAARRATATIVNDDGATNNSPNFNFRLVDATVSYQGNKIVIDGPSTHAVFDYSVKTFTFTDGTVNNNDSDPLVDDLFY